MGKEWDSASDTASTDFKEAYNPGRREVCTTSSLSWVFPHEGNQDN